jgi:hypothetical protein
VSTYADWINEEISGGSGTTERPVTTPKSEEDEYDEDEEELFMLTAY